MDGQFIDEEEVGKDIAIHNILASANLNCRCSLDDACLVLGNCTNTVKSNELPCIRIEVKSQCKRVHTVSLFENGTIQSTGGNDIIASKTAMKKVAKRLRDKLQYPVRFTGFEVQHILAGVDVGFPISLRHFCSAYKGVEYDPERFSAARVKVPIDVPPPKSKNNKRAREHMITVNVYHTGKITFTGAKTLESIQTTHSRLYSALARCKAADDTRAMLINWTSTSRQDLPTVIKAANDSSQTEECQSNEDEVSEVELPDTKRVCLFDLMGAGGEE